jgi:hypothetical protein
MVSLAVALYAAASVPYFLLVDADLADFHPHALALLPLPDRFFSTPAGCRVLNEWAIGKRAVLDMGRDVAALALLLTTSPKGAMA